MDRTIAARRRADLFFADLMGLQRPSPRPSAFPALPPRPVEALALEDTAPLLEDEFEDIDVGEAVPRGGRGRFRHDPLGGAAGDNVEARWNVDAATSAGSTIDLVVHLHGYGAVRKDFLARKATAAGVDLVDNTGAVRRADRPTLALVPRGTHSGGSTWVFDKLRDPAAFNALVDAGLSWLCTTVLGLPAGSRLARGRLTLMAHSGGGAGVSTLLGNRLDPDEVVCFDSMYGGEEPIRRWAEARISSAEAPRSGLRVFYTGCSGPLAAHPGGRWIRRANGEYEYQPPGSWIYRSNRWTLQSTEVSARRLAHPIERALAAATNGAALAGRFQIQLTTVGHTDIPAQYSPLLLDNIAATVPKASPAPPSSLRPACAGNDDWLTRAVRKPGGDAPPPARPGAAAPAAEAPAVEAPVAEAVEDVYSARDARAYTPSASATVFRAAPQPVAVTAATQWPETTSEPDAASRGALQALGVGTAGIARFAGAGLASLKPIASAFGQAALVELFTRLRYTPAQLASPPSSFPTDAALTRAFGRGASRSAILAIRTLLAIPGHFRELARRTGTEPEAFALENLGWLLMQSLAPEVRTSSTMNFWLPSSPAFVTAFANPLPSLSPQTAQLIAARLQIDTALKASDYLARYEAWRTGAPGRLWRLETGRETAAGRPAGAPFYAEPFTIPPSVNIAPQRAQVQGAWARRIADFQAGKTTVPLTQCDNAYLTPLNIMSRISLRGLELRPRFPSLATAPALTSLTGLTVVTSAFEAAFKAIADLGWNDLIFETQGMGCFRGKKIPGSAAAARSMSEHSLGIAIDVNVFENAQNTAGSMDPRIVALFEAFRFRWGRAFQTPDPMHFEYGG